jgi:L,D-transpeptidase YbiS
MTVWAKAIPRNVSRSTPIRRVPPLDFFTRIDALGIPPSRHVLWVRVEFQSMLHCVAQPSPSRRHPDFAPLRLYRISTSRFGIGQVADSNCTPLGLHRVARKIGGGWPAGTAFKAREPIGYTWKGLADAKITSRILWLEGLEPGLNRGGNVDSFARYIYIHGTGDETTLGQPASCGCIHLSADDLIPLFEKIPAGTLVWISKS